MSEIQGLPPDPGTEKRVLLAFVLTFIVIALMQPLVSRYAKQQQPVAAAQPAKPPPAASGTGQPAASAPSVKATPKLGDKAASSQASSLQPSSLQASSSQTRQASAESETVIENDLYRITFTNRGAQVRSWILKKYKDEKRNPLELVHATAAPQYGYPLSLWAYDTELRNKLNSVLYVADKQGTLASPAAVSFEFSDGQSTVRKTFSFDHTYVVRVETTVTQNGSPVAAYPAWPAGFGDQTGPPSYAAAKIESQYQDQIERVDAKKISGGNTITRPMHWAGVTGQYFAAVFLPDEPESATMVTLHYALRIPKNPSKPDPNDTVEVAVVGAAVGSAKGPFSGRMFVGPKALDVLDSIRAVQSAGGRDTGPSLDGLVDFGKWFGWLARPLFVWLEWTHNKWVSNWGWSIIILTVIINLALMPLRVTSMKSALKMQKVQPQMKAIQDRFKAKARDLKVGDPRRQELTQQQNQELAALYKEHKINPAGGCLPLLLQMPFLIAFYSMLGVTIELRQANWLWIHDLSSPDPWHLLPIAITISMFYVQRLTPQAGMDPMQQKMMAFMMPLMIGAISWSLAAGLGLYWTIGNAIAIVQQYWVNNTSFGREMRAEMEKRAAKKKGK
jgi:YidC/Oxa1 family membrane protein insertase